MRDGPHPQSLRRPHVHPAAAVDPALRREGQAEPGAQHPRRPARRADRRFDRARHDEPQDREDGQAAGASEVHLRISCPPTISPCFYGVDTPSRSELIAATHTHRGDPQIRRRRQPRLSQPRGAAGGGGRPGSSPTARPATPACIRSRFRATSTPTCSSRSRLSTERSMRRLRRPVRGGRARCGCARRPSQSPGGRPRLGAARSRPQREAAAVSARAAQGRYRSTRHARLRRQDRGRADVRRAPAATAVPALLEAVAEHADGYVRFRALVLLSGFNDPRTRDVMAQALSTPNDRLRAVPTPSSSTTPIRDCVPRLLDALARGDRSSSARR